MTEAALTRKDGRVRLAVRVTPNASRSSIGKPVVLPNGRSALAVRLAAPPVEGAANKALIACLAKALGIPRSAIRLVSGDSSRLKILEIEGASEEALARFA